jgi:hypothetical protein
MTKLLLGLALILAMAATPAFAQQAGGPGFKDPGTSVLLSVLVPGGGQIYSGESTRGLTLLGVGLGGLVVGTAATFSSVGASCDADSFSCSDDTNYLPMALGYLAYVGSWIYGIVDAGDSAHRVNAKRGLAFRGADVSVQPQVSPGRSGGTEVGLRFEF